MSPNDERPEINQDLVGIYHKHLMAFFRLLNDASHPWWWPREDGVGPEDCGVSEAAVFRSLKYGPNNDEPSGGQFRHFPGSVCAKPTGDGHVVFILSSRPSRKAFPTSRRPVTSLYKVLIHADLLRGAHITDFVKFRGPGPDAEADADLDKPITVASIGTMTTLREVSVRCLMEEFNYLRPCTVLVAGDKTQEWTMRQLGFQGDDAERRFLDELKQRMVFVTSWMATKKDYYLKDIANEWKERILAKCLRHEQ